MSIHKSLNIQMINVSIVFWKYKHLMVNEQLYKKFNFWENWKEGWPQ